MNGRTETLRYERKSNSLENDQIIYDMWASNSINSTDGRNGRNIINISKRKYNGHIKNNDIIFEERKNKRGIPILTANRRVLTCTVRSIHEKFEEKGIKTSIGKVFSLNPFFLKYATDKEMALCLCKLCLNVKMLSEPLLNQAKRDNDTIPSNSSISEVFMFNCKCDKGENGYYKLKCISDKCSQCKNANEIDLKCKHSETELKVSQFEQTNN